MDDGSTMQLPDDPAALKALCAALASRLAERDSRIERLRAALLQLRRQLYGPRADRLSSATDLAQMLLEFATAVDAMPVQAAAHATPASDEGPRRIRGHGRRRLADLDHLPVATIEHDLPESERACSCCGGAKTRIGAEESWQVEYIPGHFERWRHVRHTYACPACDAAGRGGQVATAQRDPRTAPVEKGMLGPGLMAYVAASKFADYLPLYRLESIFRRAGLSIARSTLCQCCHDVAEIGRPLYELMCDRVRQGHVVATDDRVMPMQAPERTRKARIWGYVGDEAHPYNVFDFTLSRARDGPTRFLKDFTGTLLADAYGGYDGIVAGNGMVRAGCWAHARRKFVDEERSDPAVAREAVALIDAMFVVEDRIAGEAPEVVARARDEQLRPLVAHLHGRLLRWRDELLPRSPMGGAVRYALNQWTELNVSLVDPAVPISNNVCEREMKRQALNRKNSLFVGSEAGGRTAAVLSSLTSTCKRHDVDPQCYLTQLLVNLPGWPVSDLAAWLPDEWKRRQPAG